LGAGGEQLHNWIFETHTFHQIFGEEGGEEGVDDRFAAAGEVNLGATIMGRNMFGPIRGDWTDDEWKGWWGDNPPYHHPTFVLTHHPRESITMEGGTVFHFVTDGIESALEPGERSGGRAGRPAWRRRLPDSAVSACRAGRRDASGVRAAAAWEWGAALRRAR
jgi:dihydrofolate reductase